MQGMFLGQSLIWGLKSPFEGHQGYFPNYADGSPREAGRHRDRVAIYDLGNFKQVICPETNVLIYTNGEIIYTSCCCED